MPPLNLQLRRLPRLIGGLVIFGVGIAMIVLGDYGLPGWDVFHQGLARHLPITIGTAVILVGLVILLGLVALREPIGTGTIANVFLIGLAIDATLAIFDEPSGTLARSALTLTGPIAVAIGSGLYLGVRLGPGPRDGLMTALARRGITLWKARFTVEALAFGAGAALGGTIGWGTVWFLVSIGPTVQIALRFLSVPYALDEPCVEPSTAEPLSG